ncbi:PGPGW domain-containing protein [Pseudaminobacter sp. NGMCC 1.201702]|uniref:PGPGW domain-containing protein n=1 Tax=Pseudaminobacter sp. NGMCC 1.201702 TaxID=3391825 RepID=UPI0039EEB8A0
MADSETPSHEKPPKRVISVLGREMKMPRSRSHRIAIGAALVILGIFGFLPILGFWMIPLGLLILSYEFAIVRRFRRRIVIWWERRRKGRSE